MTFSPARACVLLAALLAAPAGAFAQQRCDPALTPATGSELGYRLRGERCEGIYSQPLSAGSELVVVGLMARSADLEFRSVGGVNVRWRPVAGQNVRIQAHSLRWRVYYRMDTVRPGAASAYRWPATILGPLGLRHREVAVLAWIDVPGSGRGRMHLPVRVDTATLGRPVSSYQLTVVPETDFAAVRMTLRRRLADGTTETVGSPDVDLGLGSYPARRPFPVTLPLRGLLAAGEYELELTGRRAGAGYAITTFRFRHGAEPL